MQISNSRPSPSQSSKSAQTDQAPQKTIEENIVADTAPPPNAAAQRKAAETISATNTKLAELQRTYNSTTDLKIRHNIMECMTTFKQILHDEDTKVKKLKCHAGYQ